MNTLKLVLLIIIIILAVILILILLAGVGFGLGCKSTDGFSYPHKYLTRKNNLTNKERHIILYDMMDIFLNYTEELNVWPEYGTLLGFIRENKIICYDYDLDFGIFKDEQDKLEDILIKLTNENPKYGFMQYNFPAMHFYQLYHIETMTNCDISIYHIKEGKVMRNLIKNDFKYEIKDMFPLKTVEIKHYYKDIKYKIRFPANPEKIMETCYGKNFMIPDHKCDSDCENCVKLNSDN